MTTSLIDPSQVNASTVMFSAGDMSSGLKPKMSFKKKKDDEGNESTVLLLEDVAVFRTGSFEDSMGRRNTWEQAHMDSMVANFKAFTERNIFGDVPVRSGHPGWLVSGIEGNGKVVGWHTDLRAESRKSTHDDQEYTYLIASYEIIDEDAQKAISSGLWRNRSSEIGTYITNDGAEYFPVYMGFAYVDIPAVEGLNGFSKNPATHVIQEDSMAHATSGSTEITPPTPPTPPALPAQHAAPAEPAVHAAPAAPQMFRVGGIEVSDFAAVQRHIDTLEAFQSETIEQRRVDFVNGLVAENKILAPQAEGLTAFAKTLSDEQFSAWKETMEGAPANPALGQQAGPEQFSQGEPVDQKAEQIATLKAVVLQHKRAGMPVEQIKTKTSYGQLIELDPGFKL